MVQKDVTVAHTHGESVQLSGMNPYFSLCLMLGLRLWRSSGWDTNRPSYLTSAATPAYGECTLECSQQSKHIGGLFLTRALVIDALCPVLFCVFFLFTYRPYYHTKELIADYLRLVSVVAGLVL